MSEGVDTKPMRDALEAIREPGQVTELRALNYTRNGSDYSATVSGYFDDLNALAAEAAKLTPYCTGVYFIPNSVNPDLLARAWNKTRKLKSGEGTSDSHNSAAQVAARRLRSRAAKRHIGNRPGEGTCLREGAGNH